MNSKPLLSNETMFVFKTGSMNQKKRNLEINDTNAENLSCCYSHVHVDSDDG